MQRRAVTPTSIRPPFGRYNHGLLLPGPPVTLHMAGQLGIAPNGTIPSSVAAQTELVFANIDAILSEAGLTRRHVVKLTTYLLDAADRPAYMTIRDAWVEEPVPVSTLVIVKALAQGAFLVEVEALAVGDH